MVAHDSEQSPHVCRPQGLVGHTEKGPALGHTSAFVAIKISGCELGHIALSGIRCIYLYPFLDIRFARKRASVSNLEGR